VHDQLELAGWQVEIADAQKVKGLAPLACKTDKIDSWVLAELSRRDLVPAIWLPTPAVRAERERGPLAAAPGAASRPSAGTWARSWTAVRGGPCHRTGRSADIARCSRPAGGEAVRLVDLRLRGLCRVVARLGRRWPQADHTPSVCGEEILGIPVAERGVRAGESASCTDARGPADHFESTGMPPVRVAAGADLARRGCGCCGPGGAAVTHGAGGGHGRSGLPSSVNLRRAETVDPGGPGPLEGLYYPVLRRAPTLSGHRDPAGAVTVGPGPVAGHVADRVGRPGDVAQHRDPDESAQKNAVSAPHQVMEISPPCRAQWYVTEPSIELMHYYFTRLMHYFTR